MSQGSRNTDIEPVLTIGEVYWSSKKGSAVVQWSGSNIGEENSLDVGPRHLWFFSRSGDRYLHVLWCPIRSPSAALARQTIFMAISQVRVYTPIICTFTVSARLIYYKILPTVHVSAPPSRWLALWFVVGCRWVNVLRCGMGMIGFFVQDLWLDLAMFSTFVALVFDVWMVVVVVWYEFWRCDSPSSSLWLRKVSGWPFGRGKLLEDGRRNTRWPL